MTTRRFPTNSAGRARRFWIAVAATVLAALPASAEQIVLGPVRFELAAGFQPAGIKPPALRNPEKGISLEVSELPVQALEEFKGDAFLTFITSLGYTSATYPSPGLKRSDAHTYATGETKGPEGAQSRFLLVLGGHGRAAIITAVVAKDRVENAPAVRAEIEDILARAEIAAGVPPAP